MTITDGPLVVDETLQITGKLGMKYAKMCNSYCICVMKTIKETIIVGRKIAFVSGKGGVGKSTIVTNVAVAASQLGENVILVDADISMSDLALSLGLDMNGATLHDVLANEADLSEAIYPGPEGMKIASAGVSLQELRKAKPERLGEIVGELSDSFDLVLIDSPSGLGKAALVSLRACDEYVLVTAPVLTSIADSLRTKEIADRLGKTPLGVVVSRASDEDVDVPNEEIGSTLELPVVATVPEDNEVQMSASMGNPVTVRKPESPSTRAFKDLTWKIIVDKGKIDYQEVSENTISEIKELFGGKEINPKILLEVEKENRDRSTLKDWLRSKIEAKD